MNSKQQRRKEYLQYKDLKDREDSLTFKERNILKIIEKKRNKKKKSK